MDHKKTGRLTDPILRSVIIAQTKESPTTASDLRNAVNALTGTERSLQSVCQTVKSMEEDNLLESKKFSLSGSSNTLVGYQATSIGVSYAREAVSSTSSLLETIKRVANCW